PASQERREVTEGTLGPQVEAALLRIARREFHNAQREWDEDGEQADDPDDDGTRAHTRGDGDPAQTEGRDHVKHHEVAESQNSFGVGRTVGLVRSRGSRTRFQLSGRWLHSVDRSLRAPGSSGRTLRRASIPTARRAVARRYC